MTLISGIQILLDLDALADEHPEHMTDGQRRLRRALSRRFRQRRPPFTQGELDAWAAGDLAGLPGVGPAGEKEP